MELAPFQRLRDWRRRRAGEKPAFIVATDAILQDVLRVRPRNIKELRQIRGIGPAFCEKYGESLLHELTQISPTDRLQTAIDELPELMQLANQAIDDALGLGTGIRGAGVPASQT